MRICIYGQFKQKEHQLGRRISLLEIAQATKIPCTVMTQIARTRHDSQSLREINLSDMEKLCKYFECDLDDLVVLDPPET